MAISITGKVVRGMGYGRTIGFPTANIDRRNFARRKLKVKLGVYAGLAAVGTKTFKAGIVIGPIDKQGLPKIEAHLLGFKGSLYGKTITIALHKYLRPFKHFKNIDALKKQISLDLKQVKQFKE